jgi:YegS/Rv2252/BmrU family lipid kinase
VKIAIILNGISRKKNYFYRHILPVLQKKFSVEVSESKYSGHAIELSESASLKGAGIIFSAGGDGTLNQVVNGLVKSDVQPLPILGVIPLGSGNDFATMVKATADPNQILERLIKKSLRSIDLGKINCKDKEGNPVTRYFINVCSMGMGPATVKRVERLPRWMGTAFRYYASVLNTFLTHPIDAFEVEANNWKWKGKARVIAIANGVSFGNKIYIAPDAKPDDGVLSTFIAIDMPLPKFLVTLLTVKSGKKIQNPVVLYNTAESVSIKSPQQTLIETEGEMAGYLPAKIQILNNKIQLLV